MVKTRKIEIKKIETNVEFYCDSCGTFLGVSKEFDDGYIPVPKNAIEVRDFLKISIGVDTYVPKNEYLCENCYRKYKYEIVDTIKEKFDFVDETEVDD